MRMSLRSADRSVRSSVETEEPAKRPRGSGNTRCHTAKSPTFAQPAWEQRDVDAAGIGAMRTPRIVQMDVIGSLVLPPVRTRTDREPVEAGVHILCGVIET
jgi:hypothetical protein